MRSLTTLLCDTTDSGFGASDAWLITYRTLTLQFSCNVSKLIFGAEDVHSHSAFAALAQPPWLPCLAANTNKAATQLIPKDSIHPLSRPEKQL